MIANYLECCDFRMSYTNTFIAERAFAISKRIHMCPIDGDARFLGRFFVVI